MTRDFIKPLLLASLLVSLALSGCLAKHELEWHVYNRLGQTAEGTLTLRVTYPDGEPLNRTIPFILGPNETLKDSIAKLSNRMPGTLWVEVVLSNGLNQTEERTDWRPGESPSNVLVYLRPDGPEIGFLYVD